MSESERSNQRVEDAADPAVFDGAPDPFRSVVAALSDPVVLFDEADVVVYANDAVGAALGYDPSSLVGGPMERLFPKHRREVRAGPDSDPGAGERADRSTVVRRHDGRLLPADLRVHRWDEGDRCLAAAVVRLRSGPAGEPSTDGPSSVRRPSDDPVAAPDPPSGDRELGSRLRRERGLTDQLLRTVPTGIVVLSADGVIERVNERAASILGVDRSAVLGATAGTDAWTLRDTDGARIPPEERAFQQALATGDPVTDRVEVIEREDGTRIPALVEAAPMGEGDAVDRVIVTFQDVTDHAERERRLREETQLIESVFDAIPDLVYTVDTQGNFVRWNDRLRAVTGYSDEEIDRMHPVEFVAEDDQSVIATVLARIVAEETTLGCRADVRASDGTRIPYEFRGAPLRDEDGTVVGVTGTGRDVSDRLERERRLAEQNERLERLDRINAVIRRIDQELVRATTREEIDEAVCGTLAATDPYDAAWICDVDVADGRATPRTCAGAVALDGPLAATGPIVDAAETRSVAVADVTALPDEAARAVLSRWDDAAGAVAAVPLVHEETVYGVLVVAGDPGVFDETEQAVLGELGATVGHAVTAVTARRALTAERVTELTVRIADDDALFCALSVATDRPVAFEGVASAGDGVPRYYVVVDAGNADRIRAAAASVSTDAAVRLVTTRPDGGVLLEVAAPDTPVFDVVTDYGGVVRSVRAADGESTVTLDVPVTSDVRGLVGAIRAVVDDAALGSRHEVDRPIESVQRAQAALESDLTDRQRTAVETAYYAGFFAWPRDSTGEETAEAMGVSAPTFHKHLRVAQRKLLAALLEGPAATGPDGRH